MKRVATIFLFFTLLSQSVLGNSLLPNSGREFTPASLLYSIFHRLYSNKDRLPNSIEYKSVEHFKHAIKLNIPVELVNDLNLFSFLSYWHGTRYRFGGNSKNGIDCSAFVQNLMKDVYCINLSRVVGAQFEECREIQKAELEQGDLVFFHTGRPGLSHVGFYLGDNKFIHASVNKGICVDDLDNPYYKKAYRKSGRVLIN